MGQARVTRAVRRAVVEAVERRVLLAGDPVISEFMALNGRTLQDADGEFSDWIEIHNPNPAPANVGGYYLTDDPANTVAARTKWQFPSLNLAPGARLVVFASDKNLRDPAGQLHTNFKIDGDGDYLALVRPDLTTVTEFGNPFPPQQQDISFGFSESGSVTTLVGPGAPVRVLIPSSGPLPAGYTQSGFNDSAWRPGTTGVGFDQFPDYDPLIGTDVEATMLNRTASALIRVPFNVTNPSQFVSLKLRMKFDDGFAAYLNGQFVAGRNNPNPDLLAWNSGSTQGHPDGEAVVFEDIDISGFLGRLQPGANVLAIHGLNLAANNGDFLIVPELEAAAPGTVATTPSFLAPTPGQPNLSVGVNPGPVVTDVRHTPALPGDNDNIAVTARVAPAAANRPVTSVELRYRVMYGAESAPLPMFDDGAHGDGAAGDGVYGGTIPASASTPGQMLRYRISTSDTAGQPGRAPLHAVVASPEYFGTVINPGITSTLPVFQFFAQDTGNVTTRTGTRAEVWFNGEFYDNVFVRDRGGNTTDGIKLDFNPGQHFRWSPNLGRVDEINLNYRSADPTYLRAPLSFETFTKAGAEGLEAFPMRLQLNGTFWRVADFVENVDDDFLDRKGLDGEGALYKLVTDRPQMSPGDAFSFEKKTRKNESYDDLIAFLTGIHQSGPAQVNYLFDNFEIPDFLNYLAANTIVNDNDDAQKNYYLYRDTEGDGRWRLIPWDKDLTFGKHFGISDYSARDPQTHPFFPDSNHPKIDGSGAYNFLIDALLDIPVVKEMYRRRLRSVMDDLLQPPGTPIAQRKFEARLDEWYAKLAGDPVVLGALGGAATLRQQIDTIKSFYLEPRRNHLYVDHSQNTAYPDYAGIPGAQPASFGIDIGTIDVNPVSADQGQEFIQLTNPNPFAADISGWKLADAVLYTFEPGTVIPAGGSIYVAANVADFRARTTGPRGNQGLLVVGGYDGQLSARGETIVLQNAAGATVDSLTYAANPTLAQQGLRVTEIMYHPAPPPGGGPGTDPDGDEYEYIELRNISGGVLNLTGAKFTQGIDFTFPAMTLPAGGHVVVVRNRLAFQSRYGTSTALIAGEFTPDHLDNIGERIRLEDASGEVVLDFNYSPTWYPSTAGSGRSLAIVNQAAAVATWGDAAAWRPSGAAGGSPGAVDAPDVTAPAVASAAFDPAGPNHRVRVTFSEFVTIPSAASLTVTGPGGSRAAASVAFDAAARTATFTFTGTLPDGNFTATLAPANITDPANNALAAAYSFALYALAGDINRDRSVNGSDFALLAGNFGKTGMTYGQGDLNGDGTVNGSDFAMLAGNFGRTVTAPAGVVAATTVAPAALDAAPPPPPAKAKVLPARRVLPPRRVATPAITRRPAPKR